MAIEVARRAPVRSSTAWIRLLGRPSLTSGDGGKGVPPGLAGQKPWALLAYLVLGTQPVGRRELAEVLWPEAQDPAAAARWAIHQVRRALGPIATLADEHGRLAVRPLPGITLAVDALLLLDGRVAFDDVEDVVRGELLEGMELGEAPAFEDWLLVQRARTSSAASSTFRLAAVVSARTDPVRALRLVDRALRLDPYDDASHELAIRIEAERGASQAAMSRADAATRLYATDLGVPAPATLRRSLDRPVVTTAVPLRATARALIQTARARFDAGDYAAAIEAAERAASAGAAAGDDRVEVSALVTLAAVLLHSIQGRVHEATGLLDRALGVATALHDERLVADIERELGYVGFLSGRYGAAESILARAVERSSSVGDASGAARSLTLLGACQSDRSDFAVAEPTLVDAVARLRALGDRWEPYAMAFLARVQLRTDRAEAARALADAATQRARDVGWLSLAPWPMAVAGEARLEEGDAVGAADTFATAYALAVEMNDPCWRAFALRGLGLVARENGDRRAAQALLSDAVATAGSVSDVYAWCEAVALTDLVELEAGADEGRRLRADGIVRKAPMQDLLRRISAFQTPVQTGGS